MQGAGSKIEPSLQDSADITNWERTQNLHSQKSTGFDPMISGIHSILKNSKNMLPFIYVF